MKWLLGFATLLLVADPALAARKPKVAVPAPVVPSVRVGVEMWKIGNYPGAVAMWQPFAAAGDKDAMFNMGQAYKLGRAVPRDLPLARTYFRRAAVLGHLPAQANLGILLFQAGEKPEAMQWLKAAADKNEMRAQYVLGVANWNGDGVPRNLTLAYAYLARASALGLPEATTALNNLSASVSALERANGSTIATSIAAGNGVPAMFGGAPAAYASAEAFSREQVIKPLPKPAVVAPVVAAAAPVVVAPKPAALPPVQVAAAAPVKLVPAPVQIVAAPVKIVAAPPPVLIARAPAVAAVKVEPAVPKTVVPKPVVVAQAEAPVIAKPTERLVAPPVTLVAIPAAVAPVAMKPVVDSAPKPLVAAAKPVVAKPLVVAAAPVVVATKPVVKKPDGWRVQLGAFSKKALAEAAWTDVKAKQKQLVVDKKPIFMADGGVTKLQLGPYANKTAARDACAKIAFSGRACFVTEG